MAPALRAAVYVGSAIFVGGSLLLVRRTGEPARSWEIPGGPVEVRETLDDAVARTVREKTGLTLPVGPPLFAWTFEAVAGARRVRCVGVQFLAEIAERVPVRVAAPGHDGSAWVTEEELASYRLAPWAEPAIRAAYRSRAPRRG